MLLTFLDKIDVFFDRRFLVTYWGPAFIGVGILISFIAAAYGVAEAIEWWNELDAIQQLWFGIGVLLSVTATAYLFQAVSLTIISQYSGYHVSKRLRQWAIRDQERLINRTSPDERDYRFPRNRALLRPTQLGNIIASAEEHSWRIYRLHTPQWWDRLTPMLPEAFRTKIDDALAPLLALLNLSAIFALWAVISLVITLLSILSTVMSKTLGETITVLAPQQKTFLFSFTVGLLLSYLFYQIAIEQAMRYANLIRVSFDLYRHEILKQMRIPIPDNLVAERELWEALNLWIRYSTPPWTGLPPALPAEPSPLARPFFYDTHKIDKEGDQVSSNTPPGVQVNVVIAHTVDTLDVRPAQDEVL
jgi:hypothetical protein